MKRCRIGIEIFHLKNSSQYDIEELKVCDSIDMIEFAKWVREELDRYEKVAIIKEMSDIMKTVIKETNTISEYKKTQEMMKKLAVELFEIHKSTVEDWQNGEIQKIWFDHNGNLCIEYTSGNWWHYNEKGEWW